MDKEMKRATGCQAYANTRFLYYINEIRSAVLIVHGEKAHSRYFGESAFRYMMDGKAEGYDFARKPNPVPNNKQLLIIPEASHCDIRWWWERIDSLGQHRGVPEEEFKKIIQ